MASLLTHEETSLLQKIRVRLVGLEQFSDGYLLRWLRGHDSDLDKTTEALKNHLVFRKAWKFDELFTSWKRPEVLEKYCGYGYCGPDIEGSPVLVSLFGNMDVEGLIRSVQSQDYIKYSLMAVECGMKKCQKLAKKTGRPYEQMLLVFDLDNMTSAHYTAKSFASSFVTLITLFQEHYPLLVKKIIVIRAPPIARYAYSILTTFLSERTQKSIEMYGDDWQDVVFEHITPEHWPKYWGGQMTDPDGDPKCSSKLRLGLGPVPQAYYMDANSMPKFDGETTIHAGEKHLIEFDVLKPGSIISWQYSTQSDDVGFALYFDPKGDSCDLTHMEPLFPYVRLECSLVPLTGYYQCDKSGRYIMEFDNYYAWFTAKELQYSIDLQETQT